MIKSDQGHPVAHRATAGKKHPTKQQIVGKWGEERAADYLRQRGYQILEQNARTPYGEIDLVACHAPDPAVAGPWIGSVRPTIVFIEVKTRRSTAFGPPEESITPRKRQHLLAAIQAYMLAHPELDGNWRLDVIAIQQSTPGQPPEITHFENAITGE